MQGGLKMVDIFNFGMALKVSWVKKLLSHQNVQWFRLLQAIHGNIERSLSLGMYGVLNFLKQEMSARERVT